jgi:hypothetical protein
MDKSSRFTSEAIAFATQLRDLHVAANAIGPQDPGSGSHPLPLVIHADAHAAGHLFEPELALG